MITVNWQRAPSRIRVILQSGGQFPSALFLVKKEKKLSQLFHAEIRDQSWDTSYVIFFFVGYLLDAGRLMQESVALDTSHESSRGTTRLPSPELNADNEEFSDWDSWEGENEVQT